MPTPKLIDLIDKGPQKGANRQTRVLGIDPGESIGWSLFEGPNMIADGEIRTTEFTLTQIQALEELFERHAIDVVVYESYRIYAWKTDDHTWSEVHTAQIIGIIRYLCLLHGKPYRSQTAQIAKEFVTDQRLKDWGLWVKGSRHTRDAIRHATYFQIFGDEKSLTR